MTQQAQRFLAIFFSMILLGGAQFSAAQTDGTPTAPHAEEQIIEPELDRREVVLPRIDTEDFETGIFLGLYSLEHFATDTVYGAQVAYHVVEDLFFEIALAASQVRDSNYRRIGLNIFSEEEKALYYYDFSVGYNVFPGELFFGRGRAFTTALYVIAGVGNTHIGEDEFFTYNVGTGLRILVTDWAALHIDLRDHVFDSDLLGANETTHNLELRSGLTIFF